MPMTVVSSLQMGAKANKPLAEMLWKELKYRINRSEAPNLSHLGAVANYVNSNIATISSSNLAKLPLIYLLGDYHGTIVKFHGTVSQRIHTTIIDRLIGSLGLDFIGLENFSGNLDNAYLDNIIRTNELVPGSNDFINKINGRLGEVCNFPQSSFQLTFRKWLLNREDFLDHFRTFKYAFNPQVACAGIESPELYQNAVYIDHLLNFIEYQIPVLISNSIPQLDPHMNRQSEWPIIASYVVEAIIKPIISKFSFGAELPEVQMENDNKGWFTFNEFCRKCEPLRNRAMIEDRNQYFAKFAVEECARRNKAQMAIVVGGNHLPGMEAILRDMGVSFLTFNYHKRYGNI
jgi:hypothetical protein